MTVKSEEVILPLKIIIYGDQCRDRKLVYRIIYLSQLLYSSFKIKDYAFFLLKNFTTLNYSH